MVKIESLEKWHESARKLAANGYYLFQTQYGTYAPEGYRATFCRHGHSGDLPESIIIVTHNEEVERAIPRYSSEYGR